MRKDFPVRIGKPSLIISAKPGGIWGWVSAIDSNGRTILIIDAHRDNGKRLVVRADEKLTAFLLSPILNYGAVRLQPAGKVGPLAPPA